MKTGQIVAPNVKIAGKFPDGWDTFKKMDYEADNN